MSLPTTAQLKQAIVIAERIEALQRELNEVLCAWPVSAEPISSADAPTSTKRRNKMSAVVRAAISAATKARWAKIRGEKVVATGKKHKMSAAGRAALTAAVQKRWAIAKAKGKSGL